MKDFIHYSELKEEVSKLYNHFGKYDFYQMMYDCKTEFERHDVYRLYYKYNHDLIMESLRKSKWFNTYGIDFTRYFTPIEYNAWCVIRCNSMIFYPQYPVLNYMLDFAHPLYKIGIELDGKQYHNHEKDLARDERLHKEGWKIYRITGKEANAPIREFDREDDDELHSFLNETIEGVIESIQAVHFWTYHDDTVDYNYLAMCKHSLNKHSNLKY